MPSWLAANFYVGAAAAAAAVEGKEGVSWRSGGHGRQLRLGRHRHRRRHALYRRCGQQRQRPAADLGVYVLTEPNPEAVDRTRTRKWLPVAYPDQDTFPGDRWHFDCEAVFVFGGKLHFLTKHRASRQIGTPETGSNLYRLTTDYTDRVNVLEKVDSHRDLGGWVTGADLSPDGKTLAVLCQGPVQSVWLFDAPRSGNKFLSSRARRMVFTGAEESCRCLCVNLSNT